MAAPGQLERKLSNWQANFTMGRRRTEGKHEDEVGNEVSAGCVGSKSNEGPLVKPSNGSPTRSMLRQESRRWVTADRTAENLRGHLKRRISLSTKLFSGHLGEDRDPKSPGGLFGKKNARERKNSRPEETEQTVRMVMSAEMYDRITRAQKQERDHDSMVNQFKLRTTPTGLQGDSMWINFVLGSPQGLGILAPQKRWSPNGLSHAARVALLLTTLGQERDLLTAAACNGDVSKLAARLREQQILDFMKKSCSSLVLKVTNYYQIAAELAELRSLIEDYLRRSNANLDKRGQHEILFPFNSLVTLKIQIENLQAAELADGWRTCVKKCVKKNLRAKNGETDRSRDSKSEQQPLSLKRHGVRGMISPKDSMKTAWDNVVAVLLVYVALVEPLKLGFRIDPPKASLIFIMDHICDIFFGVDFILNFRTGYLKKDTGTLDMNPKRSAVAYLKTWAFLDFISSVGPMLDLFVKKGTSSLRAVKILKIDRVMKLSKKLQPRDIPGTDLRRIFLVLLILATMAHFLACVRHGITPQRHWETQYNRHNDDTRFLPYGQLKLRYLYLMSTYESILILMGEQIAMSRIHEYVFAIIATVLFSFLLAIIFGEVAMFIANFNELPFAYSRKMSELHETMNTKALPRILQDRVYAFYDFLWKEHKTLDGRLKIAQFLPELTPNLATEVRLFWSKDMLLNVPFFKLFPPPVVQRLVMAVDINFYMPDDYIVVAGEIGHEMFFLKSGKVDVFRVDETEIEISDGFSMHKTMNNIHHSQAIVDDQKRSGRGFMGSAKSTTRSISTGVKNVALHGVSSVKLALPARKRGISASASESVSSNESPSMPGTAKATNFTVSPSLSITSGSCLSPAHYGDVYGFQLDNSRQSSKGDVASSTGLQHTTKGAIAGNSSSRALSRGSMDILCEQAGAAIVRVRRMQREQILKTLQPGDFFGEIALVSRCPRTATVKARSFVESALVMRCDFEGMLVDHPQKLNRALAMVKSCYDGADGQRKVRAAHLTSNDNSHSHHIDQKHREVKYVQSKESIIINTTTNRTPLVEHQKSPIGTGDRI